MNYRKSVLYANTTGLTTGTLSFNIKVEQPISRIQVKVAPLGGNNERVGHAALCAKNIEIVDGSTPLFSMKGIGASALGFFDDKRPAYNSYNYLNGMYCDMWYHLNFGRYLWDDKLAFDPTKFNNPQMKIEYEAALGGNTPTYCAIQVVADLFDDKVPSLQGMLLSTEHYNYNIANSKVETVNLPTNYPIRKMLVQARADSDSLSNQITSLKLTEEFDKKVILDASLSDLYRWQAGLFPKYFERLQVAIQTAAQYIYVTPVFAIDISGQAISGSPAAYLKSDSSSGQKYDARASGACNASLHIEGFCPHGAMAFPFGKQDEIDDWWDVGKLESAQLILTSPSSGTDTGETAQVILQQMRPY